MTSAAPHGRRDTFAGALLVALFAVVFLWRPICEYGDGVFTPADFSRAYPLTRLPDAVGDPIAPNNPALISAWATSQSSLILSQRGLLHGELPAWNGFAGGGVPHLANPHTAVFSPFSWSFYVLDFGLAALITAFAKLFVVGFATFLFLRERRLTFAAALVGALTFMFAGHQVTTLFLPQSGTVFVLPAALYFVERIAREVERSIQAAREGLSRPRVLLRPAIGLALVLALGFFGGAIDTFIFCVATVCAYTVLRIGNILLRERGQAAAQRAVLAGLAHCACAAAAAVLISAIQALPYLEYMRNARGVGAPLAELAFPPWPLLVFPDLLGNPVTETALGLGVHSTSHANLAGAYVGALALFLAVFGCALARGSRTTWFFAGLAVLGLCLGFGVFGTLGLQALLPAQETPLVQRAQCLFALAIAVLAAVGVDRATSAGAVSTRVQALSLFIGAALAICFARAMGARVLTNALLDPAAGGDTALRELAAGAHMDLVLAVFVVGAGLFALVCALERSRVRAWLVLGLCAAVYAQSGGLFEHYNTVTPAREVYPRTPDINRRDGTVGIRAPIVLGDVDVPPMTSAVYGLRSFGVNDPLRVRRYDQLQQKLFAPSGEFSLVSNATRHGLRVFGIESVFDGDGWVDIDTAFGHLPLKRSTWGETDPVLPGAGVAQYFRTTVDGLQGVHFFWVTRGVPNAHDLSVTIDDLDTGTRHVGIVFAAGSIRPDGRAIVPCIVPFPAAAKVNGHALLLRITTTNAVPPQAAFAVGRRTDLDNVTTGWRATQGDSVLAGQLALDLHYALDAFELQDTVGPFRLYRFKGATKRFRTVGSASVVANDAESWARVLDASFDPATEVILEAAPQEWARTGAAADEEDARVEVLDDLNGHVRLVVKRKSPGFVVTPIAWFPGWKAKVNNREAQPLCADYAFTAVAVPEGESLVELEFQPKSLRNGIVLTLVGLLLLLIAFAYTLPSPPDEVCA
ncbi:MAG: YfhO family protein [Planctomycetes bacterium]|nr:YfhO family protein [Planctomycetota bacterium]